MKMQLRRRSLRISKIFLLRKPATKLGFDGRRVRCSLHPEKNGLNCAAEGDIHDFFGCLPFEKFITGMQFRRKGLTLHAGKAGTRTRRKNEDETILDENLLRFSTGTLLRPPGSDASRIFGFDEEARRTMAFYEGLHFQNTAEENLGYDLSLRWHRELAAELLPTDRGKNLLEKYLAVRKKKLRSSSEAFRKNVSGRFQEA